MVAPEENNKFAQVIQNIAPHSTLLRAWQLTGGVSARVTALEIDRPDGQRQKLIVRQHSAEDLKHNLYIAADEYRLLHLLHSVGLPVPTPYHLDQSGEIFSTPYIVIEYVEGSTQSAPSHLSDLILQLVTQLSNIHALNSSQLDISFLPQQASFFAEMLKMRPAKLDESMSEGRICDALEASWPWPQRNASVLLHGDFWPGNVLWRNGQIVAILDWEDARIGDPLTDVANSRLEILWAFGLEAMQLFTRQYQAMTHIDFTNLPYWDLYAALRPASKIAGWGLDSATEKTMRERHQLFVTQALEKLSI